MQGVKVKYEGGVFVPLEKVKLPEGTEGKVKIINRETIQKILKDSEIDFEEPIKVEDVEDEWYEQ